MNTVVNLSSPLVTRLASSIQLGRRERERGTAHDALSLQQSRAGGESHWFDIRRYKNHGFGDSRPTISTSACFFFIFFFDKPNFVKLGPSLSSLTDFNRVWSNLIIFKFFYLISHVILAFSHKIILRVYSRATTMVNIITLLQKRNGIYLLQVCWRESRLLFDEGTLDF